MVKDVDSGELEFIISIKDTGVYMGIKATVAFGHATFLRGTRPNWGATEAMAFMASLKFLPW